MYLFPRTIAVFFVGSFLHWKTQRILERRVYICMYIYDGHVSPGRRALVRMETAPHSRPSCCLPTDSARRRQRQHVPVPSTDSEQVQLNCRLQRSPSRCASPAEEHGRQWAFTTRLGNAFSAGVFLTREIWVVD
jgi:hypothetical protein